MSEFIHFFPGQGFRPAVWAKDYIGPKIECILPVPTPDADVAMIGKFDAYAHIPSEGYTWGTWIPAPVTDAPQITAASLAGVVPGSDPFTAGPLIPGPWHPPVDYPCNCITPDSPDMPPVAPVPVSASAGSMLAMAIIGTVFCGWMARRRA